MAIFHNRKLFPYLTKNDSSSSSAPCYDFCDPSCSNYDDCYYYPDPPDFIPPLAAPPPPPPPLPPAVEQVYQLSPLIIILVVVLAAIFSLASCSAFVLKCFTSWIHFRSQRSPDTPHPVLPAGQHEIENLFGETEGQDPGVDHPIWLISTVGLQQSVINSITVVRYKRGDGLIDGTDCSVCLGEFQEGETLRLLPKCNHAFHIDCIDPWLRSHTNCPLCRAAVVENPGPSGPTDQGLGHFRRTELTQILMHDSDSSDGEVGRSQRGSGSGVSENRGDDNDHFDVDNDQIKAEDEIINSHSWNGNEGPLTQGRRSCSVQTFARSNLTPSWSIGSSSSWRPREPRAAPIFGPGPGPGRSPIIGPIKRSYSWSERVFASSNNHRYNSKFSP